MKLFSIICESMIWPDSEGITLEGFKKISFDLKPANLSATSLWLMQTDIPIPFLSPTLLNYKQRYFTTSTNFLSNRFKTRIIANFWPYPYDPVVFDKQAAIFNCGRVAMEPEAHQWKTLQTFLRSDEPKNYEWLIYWPTIGHEDYRLKTESSGIPVHLKETTQLWFSMIRDLLPLVPDTTVLIHTDHGTARKGMGQAAYEQGFAYIPNKLNIDKLDWPALRRLEEQILCGKSA